MKRNFKNIVQGSVFSAAVLVSLLTACGGGSGGTTPPVSTPTVPTATAVSVASGVPVSATIGAAGGSVVNGKVALNIPAGALAADTLITIQPTTSTAHGGLGSAFQMTPDGQTFAKPVELKFTYTDQNLGGSSPETLGVAFQTPTGFWQWLGPVTVDSAAKTISVNTTHFTRFEDVAGYRMIPLSKTIKVKETAALKVLVCYAKSVDENDPQPLALDCKNANSQGTLVPSEWSVNGVVGGNATVGTVSGSGSGATYTAPATKPTPNTVVVSASINTASHGKTIVVSNITISDMSVYTGTVHFTTSMPGVLTVTNGLANVTWTLIEDTGDTRKYTPTGTISADMTYDGCTKVPVSSDLSQSGNNMMVYTASNAGFPNTHGFALFTSKSAFTTNCGGLSQDVPNWQNALVGSCSGTFNPQAFSDPAHLTGTYSCADLSGTTNVTWDFVLQ